jgi:2-oxoglutarate ferredoxin oxidoreductase subunit beta
MVYDPDGDGFPEPVGVFRAVERPTHGGQIEDSISTLLKTRGKGNLQDLLTGDETWTVE